MNPPGPDLQYSKHMIQKGKKVQESYVSQSNCLNFHMKIDVDEQKPDHRVDPFTPLYVNVIYV